MKDLLNQSYRVNLLFLLGFVVFGFVDVSHGAVPGKLQVPVISAVGSTSLNVTLQELADAASYRVTIVPRHDDSNSRTICTSDIELQIQNLLPDTIYYVTARAMNGDEVGESSDRASDRTLPMASVTTSNPLPTSAFIFIDDNPVKWIVEYRIKGTTDLTNVTTGDGKYYALLLEGLKPNTEYELRAIPAATGITPAVPMERAEFGQWVTIKTAPLSIFGVVTLSDTTYDPVVHGNEASSEYLAIQEQIKTASSGVVGFLDLKLIEIENDTTTGFAKAHYEIFVEDEALPAMGDFTLTTSGFQDSYINNKAKPDGFPLLIIEGDQYTFAYEPEADCQLIATSMEQTLHFSSSRGQSSEYVLLRPDDSASCSEFIVLFSDTGLVAGTGTTPLQTNEILGTVPEFFEKTLFGDLDNQFIYNRQYEASSDGNRTSGQMSGPFFRSTSIVEADIPTSNITYAIDADASDASVTLYIPKIPKAIDLEIIDGGGSVVANLTEAEIDDSSHLKVTLNSLSLNTIHSFGINATVRHYDGTTSDAQETFNLSTDSSLCATCSLSSTCRVDMTGNELCTCVDGYIGNGATCTLIDTCSPFPCDSNATCSNKTNGICEDDPGYTCSCNDGYSGNGTTCVDIVDCGVDDTCHDNAKCKDVPGGFTCTCNGGYTGNGTICEDVIDCGLSDDCHDNAKCKDVPGGFTCTCNGGYTGNGTICVDVIDCGLSDNCHDNAKCKDVPGGFTCTCNGGYTGNGTICEDVIDCGLSDDCHDNAKCKDVPGGFTCTCNGGYTGNGTICKDVIDCGLSDDCHDNAKCKDVPGGFTCTCNEGYTGNGTHCEDVIDCGHSDNCHNDATCIDVPGGFECTCKVGYTGNGTYCEPTSTTTVETSTITSEPEPTTIGPTSATLPEPTMTGATSATSPDPTSATTEATPEISPEPTPDVTSGTSPDPTSAMTGATSATSPDPTPNTTGATSAASPDVTSTSSESPSSQAPTAVCNYEVQLTAVSVTCDVSTEADVEIKLLDPDPVNSPEACGDISNDQKQSVKKVVDGSTTFDDLIPGNDYQIIVRNQSGIPTILINETFATDVISPPSLDFISVGNSSFAVNWPKEHNGTAFLVNVKSLETEHSLDKSITTTISPWTLSDLRPGFQYEVCIKILFCGASNEETMCDRTFTLPSEVSNFKFSKTSTSVRAEWDAVRGSSSYFASLTPHIGRRKRSVEGTQEVHTNETSMEFTDLSPGTSYTISVSAENAAGRGTPVSKDFTTTGADTYFPWWWIVVGVAGAIILILAIGLIWNCKRTREKWRAKLQISEDDPSQRMDNLESSREQVSSNDDEPRCCCWRALFVVNRPYAAAQGTTQTERNAYSAENGEHEHSCCPWRAIFRTQTNQGVDNDIGAPRDNVGDADDGEYHKGCCPWSKKLWINRRNGNVQRNHQGQGTIANPQTQYDEDSDRHTNEAVERGYGENDDELHGEHGCCPWRANFLVNGGRPRVNESSTEVPAEGEYDLADNAMASTCCPWTARLWINRGNTTERRTDGANGEAIEVTTM